MENQEHFIKMVLHLHAGIAGTDSAEFFLVPVPAGIPQDELEEYAYQRAIQNAESYGIYPLESVPEDCDPDEDDPNEDNYSDNMEGWFELYNPEEHDDMAPGWGDIHWQEF